MTASCTDTAHKGENTMSFNQFSHTSYCLGMIVLVVANEVFDLSSMDTAFLINHVENEFAAARDSTPGCSRTRLRTPLTDSYLLVIEPTFLCSLPSIGKHKNGKHGNKHYHKYFFPIHSLSSFFFC